MTKRPLSTISFNTEPFMRNVLDTLVSDSKIQSWIYIRHLAEEDTKKDHFHLLLLPCSVVNPVFVRKAFIEPSFTSLGDLGCLPFAPSKISDWLLYALHYEPYLLSKGLQRQNHYDISSLVSNESRDYLDQCFSEAVEGLNTSRVSNFIDMAMRGHSFGELLASGLVPPNQVVFYDKLFRMYCTRGYREKNIVIQMIYHSEKYVILSHVSFKGDNKQIKKGKTKMKINGLKVFAIKDWKPDSTFTTETGTSMQIPANHKLVCQDENNDIVNVTIVTPLPFLSRLVRF